MKGTNLFKKKNSLADSRQTEIAKLETFWTQHDF